MMKSKIVFVSIAALCFGSCGDVEAPRASADEITEISLSDVPPSVESLVMAEREGFEMVEVLKKVRDGRVYYDVEGELPGGEEIEFDVLMTPAGPEIVEIQRDIDWGDVPEAPRSLAANANTDNLQIVRVIESRQTDGSIIYEIFVGGHKSDPRFEVQVKDGQSRLLTSRWEH